MIDPQYIHILNHDVVYLKLMLYVNYISTKITRVFIYKYFICFYFFNVASGKLKVRYLDHIILFNRADRDNWMSFYTDALQLVFFF